MIGGFGDGGLFVDGCIAVPFMKSLEADDDKKGGVRRGEE